MTKRFQHILRSAPAAKTAMAAVFALGFVFDQGAALAASTAPKAVAELFTSQGCSSCPPADKLLEELVHKHPDILSLSLPVDYWDYLGWRDTLARPENSERQRAYAAQRGDRSVYTPQLVVDGMEHVIGGDRQAVLAALGRAAPFTASVELSVRDMAVEAKVDGSLPAGQRMATIFILRLDAEQSVPIARGENSGANITYVNVVRDLRAIGMWSGGPEVFRIPKSEFMKDKDSRCAVLIQIEDDSGPGRIIGAAVMDPKAP
ncbi:DUF1223 domain-containing protein [Roseibium litorale]|uniref:DUF1223 domain-containing protein n=1 Tax=Roseibium litorale TaxID=2803841 RepID=A0ABR9CP98_9HYPH|nr:DUF1223 domain-containing protein [Roseibium litorale]MBD8892107.1 DUF1223 domain-containing protein [Roseibium litorale]